MKEGTLVKLVREYANEAYGAPIFTPTHDPSAPIETRCNGGRGCGACDSRMAKMKEIEDTLRAYERQLR
jgi:hypothetical protein